MQARTLRVVLAVAIAQACLGGIAAVKAGPAPSSSDHYSQDGSGLPPTASDGAIGSADPDGAPTAPDPATPDSSPTTSTGASDVGRTPPAAEGPPSSAPTGNGEVVRGSYEQLQLHEQASVDAPAPFEPVLEGRIPDGSYWRLSAHLQGEEVCIDFARGRDGRGESVMRHCKAKDHWETAWSSEQGLAVFFGFAGLRADTMEVVLKDERVGRFPPGFLGQADISFFVVWLSCADPDVDRLRALDSEGRLRSQMRYGFATPSDVCDE